MRNGVSQGFADTTNFLLFTKIICLGKDDFFRYQSLETISFKKKNKLTCCNCTSSSSLSPPTRGPWESRSQLDSSQLK